MRQLFSHFQFKTIRPWIREFIVIVLGVLVALWVSDWNESRQNRQRERIDLQQLLATTKENEQRIDEAIAEDSSALPAARKLLFAVHTAQALPPEDSLTSWRMAAFHFSLFFPLTGTYDAIARTGDLNLIRDNELRAQVAAYPGILEGTTKQIEDWTSTFHQNVTDLIQSLPIQGIRALIFNEPAGRKTWKSPVLEKALTMQIIISQNRVSDLQQLLGATRTLRRSLESDLGNSR